MLVNSMGFLFANYYPKIGLSAYLVVDMVKQLLPVFTISKMKNCQNIFSINFYANNKILVWDYYSISFKL